MDAEKIEHSLSLLSMLNELKQRNFLCDVELHVADGNETMPAHKLILAASSDYFVKFFSENVSVHPKNITISGSTPNALRMCLDYMYQGPVRLSMDIVEDVIESSKILQLHGLTRMCIRFLTTSVSIASCLQVAKIAKRNGFDSVNEVAERFAVQHCDLVIRTDGFRNMDLVEVEAYLRKLLTPECKWEASIIWVKHEFLNRMSDFPRLLVIFLPDCTFDFLFNVVLQERPIIELVECFDMVANTILRIVNHSNLSLTTCFMLLQIPFARRSECPDCKNQMMWDFIAANLDLAVDTDGFRNLNKRDLLNVLTSANSQIFAAEDIWKYVLTWVKSDLKCRQRFLRRVLTKIRWKNCAFAIFVDHVFHHALVKNSTACTAQAAKILFKLMGEADITQNNWYMLLKITQAHNGASSAECQRKIWTYAAVNFSHISMLDSFGRISCSDLTALLQMDDVRRSCYEDVKWQAVISWVKRDIETRRASLPDILNCLNLRQWSFDSLYGRVWREKFVAESLECVEIVIAAVLSALGPTDVTVSNCYELLQLAKQFQNQNEHSQHAIVTVHQFLAKYYHEISGKDYLVNLDWETVAYIINEESFHSCPADVKWNSVRMWISHDEGRRQHLEQVVRSLRLETFPFDILERKVSCSSYIRENEFCNNLCNKLMTTSLKYADINLINWYNILRIIETSENLSNEQLEKIKQFIAANFAQISRSAHFQNLSLSVLLDSLNSPEINSTPAAEQLGGVLFWFKNCEEATSEEDLIALIRALKIEGFPFGLLFDTIMNEGTIKNSRRCTDFFLRGIQRGLKLTDLDTENWFVLLQKAKEFGQENFEGLKQAILTFVASNFRSTQSGDNFKDLEIDELNIVLQSGDLKCSEDVKASSVIQWIAHHEAARWTYLPDLLGHINLSILDKAFVRTVIYNNEMVKRSDACRDMILKSLMEDNRLEPVNPRPLKRDRNRMNQMNGKSH